MAISDMFDIIEVEIAAPHRVRIIDILKISCDAETIIGMAVFRRGVETHFFKKCAHGMYRDGDALNVGISPQAWEVLEAAAKVDDTAWHRDHGKSGNRLIDAARAYARSLTEGTETGGE